MFVASLLIPIGLFWYGWSAGHVLWIMPDIGAAIFAAGTIVCFQCMQTYIIDAYTRYAASGVAAAVVLRSLAGFGFPLFAPYMYDALGNGESRLRSNPARVRGRFTAADPISMQDGATVCSASLLWRWAYRLPSFSGFMERSCGLRASLPLAESSLYQGVRVHERSRLHERAFPSALRREFEVRERVCRLLDRL